MSANNEICQEVQETHAAEAEAEQASLIKSLRESDSGAEIVDKDEIERVGKPEEMASYWKSQGQTPDCGVVSQEMVLDAAGQPIDRETLKNIGENTDRFTGKPIEGGNSQDRAAYVRGEGTYRIGYAFEEAGVGYKERPPIPQENLMDPELAAQERTDATNYLKNELQEGKGVITAVDSNILWGEYNPDSGHAVWVTGADFGSSGELKTVYINDSGNPNGRMSAYDGQTFLDAWEPQGYNTASTRVELWR